MITPSKFVGSFHILWIYSLAANAHLLEFSYIPKTRLGGQRAEVSWRALEAFPEILKEKEGSSAPSCFMDFPLGILLTRGELPNVWGDMTVTITSFVFKSAAHGRHDGRTSHSGS